MFLMTETADSKLQAWRGDPASKILNRGYCPHTATVYNFYNGYKRVRLLRALDIHIMYLSLSLYLSICLSIYLSISLYIYIYIYLSPYYEYYSTVAECGAVSNLKPCVESHKAES